jgi:hypothetical protein
MLLFMAMSQPVAESRSRNLPRALAPEPILRAALQVVFVAAYTTRNWTLDDQVSRKQINDLWEALHEVPDLVTRWRDNAEKELLMYFEEYDAKWPEPRLRTIYDQALGQVST